MHDRRLRQGIAALAAILAVSILWAFLRGGETSNPGSRRGATSARTDAATTTGVPAAESGDPASDTLAIPDVPRNTPAGVAAEAGRTGGTNAPPVPAASLPTKDSSGKSWVRVGHLSDSGNARSRAFELRGVDTRLVYQSKAGSLSVFIVDEVQGRDATAGFADLDCDQPCEGEMLLVTPASRYHLEVDAPPGMYDVAIEEYRRPD